MENINKELINLVMARLGDSGCCKKIFSENEVASFMKLALLEVSALFSHNYSFENLNEYAGIEGLVIDYAVIVALASKALIEKGREFAVVDNGVAFACPEISNLIMEQYRTEYAHFMEKIRIIKR